MQCVTLWLSAHADKLEFVNIFQILLHPFFTCARIMRSVLHFILEVIPLSHHYGHYMRILHWQFDQAVSNALAQMDLTASQGHIMGFLSHRKEPPCSRDIEEAFHMSHPTVSGLLSRLEKKGFIEFRPDPADRRCKRIYILPKGHACHETMHRIIQENEAKVVQGFTEEEKELFAQLLTRSIANMGPGPCERKPKEEETQ